MRGLALVLAALLFAGCARSGDEEPSTTTPSPTPTPSPTTPSVTPSPAPVTHAPTTAPTNGTRDDANKTRYHDSWTHRFSDPPKNETLVVPANPAPANITISFVPTSNGEASPRLDCAGDARVAIVAPNGTTLVRANASDGDRCSYPTRVDLIALHTGNWTIRFAGRADAMTFVIVSSEGNANETGSDRPPGTEPVSYAHEHDFSRPPRTDELDVPENARPFMIVIQYAAPVPGAPCLMRGGAIDVTDPHGVPMAGLAQDGIASSDPVVEHVRTPAPGRWTISYAGTGTCLGRVDIH